MELSTKLKVWCRSNLGKWKAWGNKIKKLKKKGKVDVLSKRDVAIEQANEGYPNAMCCCGVAGEWRE